MTKTKATMLAAVGLMAQSAQNTAKKQSGATYTIFGSTAALGHMIATPASHADTAKAQFPA